MLREITDKTEWDKLYSQAHVASGKFLQSWQWGELQMALGRKIHRFADDGFLALVVELPLPLEKKYWFCPKGPVVMDNGQWTMDNPFTEELRNKAKEAGAVFLRIEPPAEDPIPEIGSRGVRRSHDINPRATSIIDLSKTEDELLAAMHPKTRYNIKVAEKHGVTIERWTMNNEQIFKEVMKLFQETAKRDGFRLHPTDYYRKQLKIFDEKTNFAPEVHVPHTVIFAARAGGKMLAVAIVMFDGEDVTYLHGASSSEMRNVMAPYALHWAIIRRAKERGYKHYDLWGVSDDPRSSWAGITRFKHGWGGDDVKAVGTLDLPLNGFWYNVYTLARHVERMRFYVPRRLRP